MKHILYLMAIVLMTACAQQPATVIPSQTPASPTAVAATTAPTQTATATTAPTATRTRVVPTATNLPTATPKPALDQAEVIQIEDGVGGTRVVLVVPDLTTPYDLILGGIRFGCAVDAAYPGRLFCWGLSWPALDQSVTQAFLDPQTGKVVYETKVVLSSAQLGRPTPEGYAETDCPDRGKGVSCEVECRIESDGSPCIVATCTDACGLYRSVHTCTLDLSMVTANCSPEQWAAMKKLYQLP